MQFLLIAALVAAAAAAPKTFITPGATGPEPVLVTPGGAGSEPVFVTPGGAGPEPVFVTPGGAGPEPVFPDAPIDIGPAIIDEFVPIAGPAFIDPSIVPPSVNPSASLVQIILNIKAPSPIVPAAPIARPEPIHVEQPVSPVQVVDGAPAPVEPVIVGTPILPSPVINLPDELN